MISVLIVDDQHLFAESLKYVLEGEGNGEIEVAGIAENGREATKMVEQLRPDLVLMDIRMPVMDGVEATNIIHQRHPSLRIMILTTFDDDELAFQALSHGATGYVLKSIDPTDLILSIKAVWAGGFYISPSVGCKLVTKMKPGKEQAVEVDQVEVARLAKQYPSLSLREAEVTYLVAKARRNKDIADALSISEKTVKNHINSIFHKLSIRNRLELIHTVLE